MKNWKLVGLVTTVVGAVVSVISSLAESKRQDETIARKVSEAVAKLTDKTEG